MFGKLSPAPLVVEKIDVELRQARNLESALFEHAVEDAGVVGAEEMNRAFVFRGRPQAERARDQRRVALDVGVNAYRPSAPATRATSAMSRRLTRSGAAYDAISFA